MFSQAAPPIWPPPPPALIRPRRPRCAGCRRSSLPCAPPLLCVAEMRYHLAEARFLEFHGQGRQMSAHPFATLLDDFLERLLVLACRHRDQLVGGGYDQVVAEESMLLAQLISPALVDHAHHLDALTRIHLVPPDAHEHSRSFRFLMSIRMR